MFGVVRLGPRGYMDFKGGSTWLPPTLPGNSGPLHPLLTWYAVLFGLSELAPLPADDVGGGDLT